MSSHSQPVILGINAPTIISNELLCGPEELDQVPAGESSSHFDEIKTKSVNSKDHGSKRAPGSNGVGCRLSFVLLDGYSYIALGAILDVLHVTNLLYQYPFFSWQLDIETSEPLDLISASNAKPGFSSFNCDMTIFVGSESRPLAYADPIFARARNRIRRSNAIGAVGTGIHILARAGLLAGRRAAAHFSQIDALSELYPATNFREERCCFDRYIWTCPGGTAAIDLALAIVRQKFDGGLAEQVAWAILHDQATNASNSQRLSVSARFGMRSRGLLRAISYIENLGEEPFRAKEMVKHVELSARQIERLFRRYSMVSPAQYDKRFRLSRARDLLKTTKLSLREISLICGYVSLGHFSRKYRAQFGEAPSHTRRDAMHIAPVRDAKALPRNLELA